MYSVATGWQTVANSDYQVVHGSLNVVDEEDKYAFIIGNGYVDQTTFMQMKSNAFTVDKNGNGWFKKDVYVGGTNQEEGERLIKESDFETKVDKENPTGTGALSINRKSDTTIGTNSVAVGHNNTASGMHSFAEGSNTVASGMGAHSEGVSGEASGMGSHAENSSDAKGNYSHSEGYGTVASGRAQHVQGRYNIEDAVEASIDYGVYAHIIGNGESDTNRSNAHTVDWDGNAWYAGNVYIGGTSKDDATMLIAVEVVTDEEVSAFMAEYDLLKE